MFRIDTVLKITADHGWLICKVVFAGYLGVLTVMDIRHKRLNLLFLLSGFLLVIAGWFFGRDLHPLLRITGSGVGLVFLLASRVTGESFGYGDSLLILIMGGFLGFWDILSVLMAAFLLAAAFSGIMLVRKRFSRKTAFPFVPFLMIAYTGGMILGIY
ncbi:MAG TPA: prepilin peptidase [Candidatus Mediterraneibacter quadrami]|uniref:Prepilin peptidase n=1 Tax=Candidatus Mediterraneibacter quadrami TaxID=2838684 RepID=A0A9D2REJ4_9FIRM|nr:prepilin peptidase [Candidatus Mediterraneibacter quadrami]